MAMVSMEVSQLFPSEVWSFIVDYLDMWAVGRLFCIGSKNLSLRLLSASCIRSMWVKDMEMMSCKYYPAAFRCATGLKHVIWILSQNCSIWPVWVDFLDCLPESIETLHLPMDMSALEEIEYEGSEKSLKRSKSFKSRFPNLKELILSGGNGGTNVREVINKEIWVFPVLLQSLSLNCMKSVDDPSIAFLLTILPINLQHLSLVLYGNFNLDKIGYLNQLKSLSLPSNLFISFSTSVPLLPMLHTLDIGKAELFYLPGTSPSTQTQFSFFSSLPASLTSLRAIMFLIEWNQAPWWQSLRKWTRCKGIKTIFSNFTEIPPNLTWLETEWINSQILGSLVQELPTSLRYLKLDAECGPQIMKQFPNASLEYLSITFSQLEVLYNLPTSVTHLTTESRGSVEIDLGKVLNKLEKQKISFYTHYKSLGSEEPDIPYEHITYCFIPELELKTGYKGMQEAPNTVSPFFIASNDLLPLLHFLIEQGYYEVREFQRWEVMAVAVKYGAISFLNWLSSSSTHIIPSLILQNNNMYASSRVQRLAQSSNAEEVLNWLNKNRFGNGISPFDDEDPTFVDISGASF